MAIAGVVLFGVLQLLPFGRVRNPPVTAEPAWPSSEVRSLAVRACFDCHSNQTRLEWFDRVAPGSWLVANHVNDGRSAVNFSQWDRRQKSDDLAKIVEEGDMPPRDYVLLHRNAKLSAAEKQALIAGLARLAEAGDNSGSGGRGGDG
jgi:hypothetical protein